MTTPTISSVLASPLTQISEGVSTMPAAPRQSADLRSRIRQADALLLDYNGTLSDDEDLLAELICHVSSEHLGIHLSRDRYYADFVGFTEEYMFGILREEAGVSHLSGHELLQIFNGLYLERTREESTISPAAKSFVKEARRMGKRLMVVTAASRDVVIPALERASLLADLDGVVALEDVTSPKPDPAGYLHALDRLGLHACRAVAFEDSRTGIMAARAAGVETVGVAGSLPVDALHTLAHHTITSLDPHLLH
ncbi:HAD family phosphatase [Rothia koreensis]